MVSINFRSLLIFSAALRIFLIIYGEWQDTHMEVRYTDIDYYVFSDAASLMASGRSPYERSTYRYSPLLAFLLVPNSFIHQSWGKFLFSASGSVLQAAIWYGLVVHFRVYPIIYALPILLVLHPLNLQTGQKLVIQKWSQIQQESSLHSSIPNLSCMANPLLLLRNLFTRRRLTFGLLSGTFLIFTGVSFYLYGWEFLHEALLYHLTRTDPRHNFSIYFYHIYLHHEHAFSVVEKLISFLPQLIVQLALIVRFAQDLPFCLFVQTVAFVAFNKCPPSYCNLTHSPIFPPFHFTVTSCSTVSDVHKVHTQMIKHGNYSDGFIGNRLVTMYATFGSVDSALKLFEEIPDKDLISWNSMIGVFAQRGNVNKCFSLFSKMRSEMGVEPNEVTLISLLPVCINMRALTEACELFNTISSKNLVSWNSMIAAYSQNGFLEDGINLFNSMRRVGFRPDRATIVTLLQVCAELAAEKQGKAMHGYILSSGFSSDMPIATALIRVYAKSGRLDASYEAFSEISFPDKIAWTAILAGYAIHGYARKAIKVFDLMVKNGAKPDHVTFAHILSACSHSGLIEEGKHYFQSMSKVYGVEPDVDHYSCMVDLLGRLGRLDEARELIEAMPTDPNPGVWGALLGACRVHHNIKLGKEIAEKLFMLDPTDPRNYIMLSNMYSASGLWREASQVRALMKERGLRKHPGCSFIEHGGKVYRFVVGDRSHPESDDIHSMLDELITKIQKAGYVPNTDLVLHDVDEEMKADMISKHSEKIAIAFGLLVTNHGRPITITKNLRICGDCHNAAKFISVVEKRKIIIRDSKRFHHFLDGAFRVRFRIVTPLSGSLPHSSKRVHHLKCFGDFGWKKSTVYDIFLGSSSPVQDRDNVFRFAEPRSGSLHRFQDRRNIKPPLQGDVVQR
ncbi:hypothetical protein C5167_010518 [Papaver somniferum]|uniref:DYW domain-containing protein n=1 Tax=Papaver somniferum TaxID=3469 RepID=A0A4Y7K0H0_PAPSO|nr:hypothetical protein C5167_010518 [Papaver somniferum]